MSVLVPLGPPSQLPLDSSKPAGTFRVSIPPRPAIPPYSPKRHSVRLTDRPVLSTTSTSSSISSSTTTSTASAAAHSHAGSASTPSRDPPTPRTRPPLQVGTRHSSASNSNTMSALSMQRQPTTSSTLSGLPRRSTSGRSAASNAPTSYVALMRKQKATVWCDRSQSIEPHAAAAEKRARLRALAEVSQSMGGAGSTRTATISSGVVGKIRHGGVPKAPGYVAANMSGVGVPMRLSANEMLGDEEEERSFISGDNAMVHGRSGSGKSSTSSAKYRSGYPRADQGRFSGGASPMGPDTGSPASRDRIPEEESTAKGHPPHNADEEAYGELRDLAGPSALETRTDQVKKTDDLRRRGSVDERAMTMGSSVKLFVANPDIDSD